ncbi:MAG: thiamine phosphate synthase, partial [Phycisphaerae bacterium]
AIRGGATCLQLREKDLSDQELLERASEFVAICRAGGAISVINDRCDVAMASGADGVHVGQDDIAVTTVRRLVGPDMVIGVSTHNLEQARAAAQSGVDYVAIGPMYATSTKPRSFVAGIETLSNVRKNMSLPLVAIGGIDAARAGDVMQAGADCLCVCTAVTAHDDPESQARAFSQHFAGANAGA